MLNSKINIFNFIVPLLIATHIVNQSPNSYHVQTTESVNIARNISLPRGDCQDLKTTKTRHLMLTGGASAFTF